MLEDVLKNLIHSCEALATSIIDREVETWTPEEFTFVSAWTEFITVYYNEKNGGGLDEDRKSL